MGKDKRKTIEGYQFYRQKTIGNYIIDFYCPKAKLIIELDGGQHYNPEGDWPFSSVYFSCVHCPVV